MNNPVFHCHKCGSTHTDGPCPQRVPNPTEPQSEKVKQYSHSSGGTFENAGGAWIKASDYEALRAQVATLTRERDEANRRSARKDSAFCGLITERDAALSDLSDLRREAEQLREDKEIIDWVEKRKRERVAGWDGKPDDPSHWRNPSVKWSVERSIDNGTYQFPKELSELTLREAVRAAMSRARETEGEG